MTLVAAVGGAFDAHGVLAQTQEEFAPRAGQTRMALAVATTIAQGGVLVAEAGTGVGKTFAYLVPALLSGKRVLVSTATKALQDQLFGRDIPRLRSALNLPVRVALLKGRASYLCLQRLASARLDLRAASPQSMRHLAQVEIWSTRTRTGDLAEVGGLDEASAVVPLVSSTRENCLGQRCPQFLNCHVNAARKEAQAADVVVINHHLFFADLNIRESGVAELLPTVNAVIFDEAHQLNEIGVQFLGRQLTTGQLQAFCRDLTLRGPQFAGGAAHWHLMALDLERLIAGLRSLGDNNERSTRRGWSVEGPQGIAGATWTRATNQLYAVLADAQRALEAVAESSPELQNLLDRAEYLLDSIRNFSQPLPLGCVRWWDVGNHVRWMESPLDISETMQSRVMQASDPQGGQRSWVFTSATLGGESNMGWFIASCGLQSAELLRVDSPFDYPSQACVYVPATMPKPSDPGHSASVAQLVAESAAALGGRTLVLTTTLRAMRSIGASLQRHFSLASDMEVLVQGQSPKRELVERFSQQGDGSSAGCILVASASFWEGVDIPGDALQLLVIDKLPFSPPDDPLVQARVQQMEASGKNAFKHLHLPQAAMALKQGAGRLIRRETDRGILVVCDVRLSQMGYGRQLLASLPPMRVLACEDQFKDALSAITKLSTTDQIWI